MRKTTILLSIMVLAAMILAACSGGNETSTSVATSLPVTSVATEPSTATEMPTEAATEAPVTTETPGVPVTGASNVGRMSERLAFKVMDQTGNQVGKVNDLVLDLSQSKVVYVIVDAGGQNVAVPRDLFTIQAGTSTGSSTSTPSAGSATSTPSTGGSGTGSATSTPLGVATGQSGTGSGTDLSTSTPSTGGSGTSMATSTPGTGTGVGSMGEQAFILEADATMLQNAPAFDSSSLPGLGQTSSDWDASIRDYWSGGATTGSNTPSPMGTAVTDMTATATSGSGTGSATSTPGTGSSGAGSSTSTPAAGSSTGQGATTLQGVALASEVIGANVTLGMQTGTGTGMATSTPSAGSTGSATSTPGTGGSGTGSSTSTPAAGSGGTGTNAMVSGTIDDLLVDGTGVIRYIVVRTNLTSGESLIPVPLSLFQLDSNNAFVLNVDTATLQSAPSFLNGQFPDTTMPDWDSDLNSFWQSNGATGGSGSGEANATPTP